MRLLGLMLGLAACVPVEVPPPLVPEVIEVASGGMLGQTRTLIYGNDWVITQVSGLDDTQKGRGKTVPGAYARAAAVIAAEGGDTLARVQHGPEVCMDYGADIVQASPPIAGFERVVSDCPDAAVTALMGHVLAALAAPK